VHSFTDLSAEQQKNFDIKEGAFTSCGRKFKKLAVLLKLEDEDEKAAVLQEFFTTSGASGNCWNTTLLMMPLQLIMHVCR
jgi:hypothetical protein